MAVSRNLGLIVCIVLPIALLLFGVVTDFEAVGLVLLLSGLWIAIFGALFAANREKSYYVGLGGLIAVVSTFVVLPVQYTVGLLLVAIIAIVLALMVLGARSHASTIRATPRVANQT
jgi:predicted branched-subunit amino acid permease